MAVLLGFGRGSQCALISRAAVRIGRSAPSVQDSGRASSPSRLPGCGRRQNSSLSAARRDNSISAEFGPKLRLEKMSKSTTVSSRIPEKILCSDCRRNSCLGMYPILPVGAESRNSIGSETLLNYRQFPAILPYLRIIVECVPASPMASCSVAKSLLLSGFDFCLANRRNSIPTNQRQKIGRVHEHPPSPNGLSAARAPPGCEPRDGCSPTNRGRHPSYGRFDRK